MFSDLQPTLKEQLHLAIRKISQFGSYAIMIHEENRSGSIVLKESPEEGLKREILAEK